MSNIYGKNVRVSIFGESHGAGIGIVIDGVKPGTPVDMDRIAVQMARRAPGGSLATARREADQVEILSGILNGKAEGTPICGIIRNTDTRSSDYLKTAGLSTVSRKEKCLVSRRGFGYNMDNSIEQKTNRRLSHEF